MGEHVRPPWLSFLLTNVFRRMAHDPGRIRLHLSSKDRLGVDLKADFALAFWMAHEVADRKRLFAEVLAALKPGGLLLLVEPRTHVHESLFAEIVAAARRNGSSPAFCQSLTVAHFLNFLSRCAGNLSSSTPGENHPLSGDVPSFRAFCHRI